jgi:hypothetical protein
MAQRLDPGQAVDEEAVAGVGGHPAGAGVRLADVALLLEDGHVVAHRGRGHAELVALHQRLAAHRLLGRHVVLDDGAEHLELAVIETHDPSLARPHSPGTLLRRVPVYVAPGPRAMIVGGQRLLSILRRRPHVALALVDLRSYGVAHD